MLGYFDLGVGLRGTLYIAVWARFTVDMFSVRSTVYGGLLGYTVISTGTNTHPFIGLY